jgi:hypothetical protein
VQDALAVGVPVICSDLPVHREQAPLGARFDPSDHEALAAEIAAAASADLPAGGAARAERERKALDAEREFAVRHGELLWSVLAEGAAR